MKEVGATQSVLAKARQEVQEEITKKAVEALKRKLRDQAAAKSVLANIDREIADLEQSIVDGSFVA